MININNKADCCGCSACYNICSKNCISMNSDSEGFWYPKVNREKCIECGMCEKVCPLKNHENADNIPVAYASLNINENIRMESSSGGVFTLIAEHILNNDGLVAGVVFNDNFEVIHEFIDSKDKLFKVRGSKYVQSNIGNTFKTAEKYLKEGRFVLYTGTPCQISGFKSFLGEDYDNLICMDIVCHGVPSPKVWKKYIEFRENQAESKIVEITFRNKDDGWKKFSSVFLFEDGTKYQQHFKKDLYMKAFLGDVCLRPSCYDCKFKATNRHSDITLADFWGIQYVLPEFDDDKGTSLILVNSDKGKTIFNQISVKTKYKEADIDKAIKYNMSYVKSADLKTKRDVFFRNIDRITFDKLEI